MSMLDLSRRLRTKAAARGIHRLLVPVGLLAAMVIATPAVATVKHAERSAAANKLIQSRRPSGGHWTGYWVWTWNGTRWVATWVWVWVWDDPDHIVS